jgi:ABC-type transporter Mla MlaB component
VTVRITVAELSLFRRIAVEGRLTALAVSELEQAVDDEPHPVVLDLAQLRSADPAGLAALRRLREMGVAMKGTGLHLAWKIEADS